MLGKKSQNSLKIASLSGTAVAVLVAAVFIAFGKWIWGIVFIILAILLAYLGSR